VRHCDIEASPELRRDCPILTEAVRLISDPLVRNMGTAAGSVCHADPQGDWASVLTALGGQIVAVGPGGRRTIPVNQFVTGPFQTVLGYDEIAIDAIVPAPRGAVAGGYLKLERRVGDFATAGVAVAVETSGESVVRAGIALTGVGGHTIDAIEAAAVLVGTPLGAATIARAADLAAQAAEPRSDHRGTAAYKRHVVATFVERILSRIASAAERAA
jgi:carbon-monoxide dehydrogenase medium subunit